ncbi:MULTISPECIES: methylmalonyl-CoA mutase [Pseudomonas]
MTRPLLWRPLDLQLKPVYQASDLEGLEHLDSHPGRVPFVRGPYPGMYTERPWTLRQYTGFAGAQACNQRLRQSLAEGAQGLSLAFDLPTHRGYDSSDPQCHADVGKTGVAIDSVEDMRDLLAGIELDKVSVSMTMNGAVLPILAAFIVAAEESGVPPEHLQGTIQNDILKEFMVRNTYIFAPQPSMRISLDVIEYLSKTMPRFNPISVSGYHFQEAGADAITELALTLVNARTYAQAVAERGLDLAIFCARMSFFFGVGSDFFTEVAKLRAARLLWCEMVRALGVDSEKAQALRMHCQTSGWSLSAQTPLNNVARTTVQAMAAVFGGTQSLHTNAWDEALALPSEDSARLARDTQHILQQETGLCDVVDPWAGSYMMEALTANMAERVRQRIAEIDREGGALRGIESGRISRLIHAQAIATQARLDSGAQPRVGRTQSHTSTPLQTASSIDSCALRARQVQRLDRLRLTRQSVQVEQALDALAACARTGQGNLLQVTIAAIRARATVGECTQALERVWPRFKLPPEFMTDCYGAYLSEDPRWRSLCQRVQTFSAHHGRAPTVVLGKLGQDGHDRGLRLIAAALTDAGIDVRVLPMFMTPAQFFAAFRAQGTIDLIGISSLAGAHVELLTQLMALLKGDAFSVPVVVGGILPQADIQQLRSSGIAACFGPEQDPIEIIGQLLELLEQLVQESTDDWADRAKLQHTL